MPTEILYDEAVELYHANPAVGSTMAKQAKKSLQLFNDHFTGLAPAEMDKPCWQEGRIIHMRVLEPERYAATTRSQGPMNPKTGKPYGRDTNAFADWQAANPGVIMVEPFMDMMCHRIPEEVAEVLRTGKPEVSIRTEFSPRLTIQCRPDWMRGVDDWDLKTIDDVDNWQRAVRRLDYWLSAGWYKLTKAKAGFPTTGEWRWIFAEKAWPFRWRVVRMSAAYVERAMEEAQAIATRIDTAMATGDWRDESGEIVAELPPELDDQEFTVTAEGGISL